jgi:hypothetical protein
MICNPKLDAMKTNSTLIVVIRIVAFILLCLYSLLVFGQNDYSAQNKNLLLLAAQQQNNAANLVAFEGADQAEKIRLQWTLADDNNATSVLLEKSSDGKSFQYVADFWVNLDGNTMKNFRFSDAKKNNKKVIYRLKITDAHGQVQFSEPLSFGNKDAKK